MNESEKILSRLFVGTKVESFGEAFSGQRGEIVSINHRSHFTYEVKFGESTSKLSRIAFLGSDRVWNLKIIEEEILDDGFELE